jgi:hypothetical protein
MQVAFVRATSVFARAVIPWLKLACLVHGGGQQELESLLDFGRLGVEERGEGSEFGEKLNPSSPTSVRLTSYLLENLFYGIINSNTTLLH